MPRTSWTAPALRRLDTLPPTYAGLASAVRIADQAARLLASAADPDGLPATLRLREECANARTDLEANSTAAPAPLPPLAGPEEPVESDSLRAVHPLLLACLELAGDVLENDAEPLTIGQITAIGQAVAHLDCARRHCWEPAR